MKKITDLLLFILYFSSIYSLAEAAGFHDDLAYKYYGYQPSDQEVDEYWFNIYDGDTRHPKYYYSNGQVRHEYTIGLTCGVRYGIEKYYYSNGKLDKTIEHLVRGESCSSGWSIKKVKKYNINGNLISSYSYTLGDESTIACKCGTWEAFDVKGKRISNKAYSNCERSSKTNKACYQIR